MTAELLVDEDAQRDARALALRDAGRPFAGIAHILGYADAHAANAAFNRGLRGAARCRNRRSCGVARVARLEALALARPGTPRPRAWKRLSVGCAA